LHQNQIVRVHIEVRGPDRCTAVNITPGISFRCCQWSKKPSNCGGTRGNGVPLPFLAGERCSPSLHDRCGWTRGNVA